MTDSLQVSKRFETPLMDSLKPMHQKVVIHYAQLLEKRAAVLAAGYVDNAQLSEKVKEIFALPEIIAAIDEYLATKLDQLDSGRAAICERLLNQSLATIHDVAKRVEYVNGFGKTVEGKYIYVPKELETIEPRFRCAQCFLVPGRDGMYTWDNMSQWRATTHLSKLMMWDQSVLDTDPPIVYNFGDVQNNTYVAPSSEVDLSAVEDTSDEITDLTH